MTEATVLAPDNAVGHPAEHLLAAAIDQGGLVLHRLAEEAVRRLLEHGHAGLVLGHFLTRLELAELAEMFAAVLGTAELLGRALVRDREQQVLLRHRTAQESRQRVLESAPVPIRTQATSFTCGAAALRAVLARFGIHRYESDLAGKLGTDSDDGTRPGELLGLARAFGLHAEDRHDLTVFDLAHATDDGLPVICCVQMHGGGHWVVVVDAGPDRVLYMDPADGSYHWLDAPTWDSIWYDTSADSEPFYHYGIALAPPDADELAECRRIREEFDPSEKRDDTGKWTKGGSSSKKAAEKPKSKDKRAGDKTKYIGQAVGAAEHAHADHISHSVAGWVGGVTEEDAGGPGQKDKKPFDVRAPKKGGGFHDIEVKSLLKGEKQGISVHEDALLRKVDHIERNPQNQFHTVVVDERETYGGGQYQDNYSGHRIYYKRGSGRYTLAQMHPVKDEAELKRLLATPDEKLPVAARGHLPPPPPLENLREAAAKASESRKARDKKRKEKNKDLLRAQARARAAALRRSG